MALADQGAGGRLTLPRWSAPKDAAYLKAQVLANDSLPQRACYTRKVCSLFAHFLTHFGLHEEFFSPKVTHPQNILADVPYEPHVNGLRKKNTVFSSLCPN